MNSVQTSKPWLNIPGATTEVELDWLFNQAKGKHLVYELGSYLGRSTLALLESGSHVYAVDDWFGPRDIEMSDEERASLYDRFIENTCLYPNLHVIRINHSMFVPHTGCDMVFIDGSHEYEDVMRDILKFREFKNCLICGHDYAWWNTVRDAVNWVCGRSVRTACDGNIWYLQQ